jgi:hypothetical protein
MMVIHQLKLFGSFVMELKVVATNTRCSVQGHFMPTVFYLPILSEWISFVWDGGQVLGVCA